MIKTIFPKKSTIGYFEAWAKNYDVDVKKQEYFSPEVVFGLVFEYLKPKQKLLDVGCGSESSSELFAKFGLEIYGIDGSKNMINEFQKKGLAKELMVVDLNEGKYPYQDNFFDHVIANGIFCFFGNLQPFIKETARVLKNGGIFGFTIEEFLSNKKDKHASINNGFISENIFQKTGIKYYRHDLNQIKNLLNQNHFAVLKILNFRAFKSISEGKYTYFTAIIAHYLTN